MPAESTVYRWLKESDDAETLRAALQRVDLEAEFREFLLEKYARVKRVETNQKPSCDCLEQFSSTVRHLERARIHLRHSAGVD